MDATFKISELTVQREDGAPFLWYLATPYSKWPLGPDDAHMVACDIAGRLLLAGVHVYSPIAETHPISRWVAHEVAHNDHEFWLLHDEPKFDRCDGLLVADMEGWDDSRGVRHEIERAAKQNKMRWLLSRNADSYRVLPV